MTANAEGATTPMMEAIYTKVSTTYKTFTDIVNLTPHELTVYIEGKVAMSVPPSGKMARLAEKTQRVGQLFIHEDADFVPLVVTEYAETYDLPPPKEGIMYFVSLMVLKENKNRKDLLAPGEQMRDTSGRIVGVKSFQVNP
ncbi:MAG: hypothetical protein HXS54_06185 [Theionarchaea archaeon]|nr:hypothetical protein [Theionarchaea archaeon]DBA34847.1 TPA_asm: hypothetical protein vir521_00053 [Caudoviricetes sp. vir521]